jgi:endonuclease/exonuclease/phosphatase family metal-dependent hydrolase
MANTFRIGTYNCHNLFHRSRVLDFKDPEHGEKILNDINQLYKELEKPVFDAEAIIKLYNEINVYDPVKKEEDACIEIHNIHGGLIGKHDNGELFVKAKKKEDWIGYITMARSDFVDQALKNTAKVIHEMNADVLSLVEIEDKRTLDQFNSQRIGKDGYNKYTYTMLIDGYDPRGIDVALLSRYPYSYEDIRTHIYDPLDKPKAEHIFSRDCLEVKVKMAENDFIYFFVNHFKSQCGGPQKSDDRRLKQTERVAEIILDERKLNPKQDKFVILGDFNTTPTNPTLAPLLSDFKGLTNILAAQYPQEEDRWTYAYKKSKNNIIRQQLDYILVSEPLRQKFVKAGIVRGGIYKLEDVCDPNKVEKSWDTVTKEEEQASDHAGIWAEFRL